MIDANRRKELKAEYQRNRPEAGVYRITNTATGRVLLVSTTNLGSARNRFNFSISNKSTGGLDQRLKKDVAVHGFDGLSFDVIESFEPAEDATPEQIAAELKTLEQLWREQLSGTSFY